MVFQSRALSFIALAIIGAAIGAPTLAADLPIKADTYWSAQDSAETL